MSSAATGGAIVKLLLFVIIELATALAVVVGVTWATGHWR